MNDDETRSKSVMGEDDVEENIQENSAAETVDNFSIGSVVSGALNVLLVSKFLILNSCSIVHTVIL